MSVPRLEWKKCQMILVQMYNIFRLVTGVPDYSIVVSRMEENKKHVENDKYLNKRLQIIYNMQCCLSHIN